MTYPPQGPPPPSPEDWLMGGGTKSASFDGAPPITNAGQIVAEPTLIQKRDFDTGDALFWQDGRPKMLMQVNLATDQRDPADPEDDGTRAIYLEFRKAQAVRDAVRKVGSTKLEVGGYLALTYVSDDHAARKGKGNAPKNYTAEYRQPDPFAAAGAPPAQQQGGWGNIPPQGQQPPQQPPAQGWQQQQQLPPQAPPPQPTPATVSTGIDPALYAWLQARNIDPSQMNPQQAGLIAQTMGYTG